LELVRNHITEYVPYSEIAYIKHEHPHTIIYGWQQSFRTTATISDFVDKLPPVFFRTSRTVIVNVIFVQKHDQCKHKLTLARTIEVEYAKPEDICIHLRKHLEKTMHTVDIVHSKSPAFSKYKKAANMVPMKCRYCSCFTAVPSVCGNVCVDSIPPFLQCLRETLVKLRD
jgi:hypothetical protein